MARIGAAGRARVLAEHTSEHRARTIRGAVDGCRRLAPVRGRSLTMWGIVPAAGRGSRIQPLAFSKELLPVGSRLDGGVERPCAVSEYLLERMVAGGADKICFVISPGQVGHPGLLRRRLSAGFDRLCGAAAARAGLCDAVFRAAPLIAPDEPVMVGLPDTIWFPETGFAALPDDRFRFCCSPSSSPEFFDAVVLDENGAVREIQVKRTDAASHWIWGALQDARPRCFTTCTHSGSRASGRTNISAPW